MKTDNEEQNQDNAQTAECDSLQRVVMQDRFEIWWDREGMGKALQLFPEGSYKVNEVREMCRIAWSNGADILA